MMLGNWSHDQNSGFPPVVAHHSHRRILIVLHLCVLDEGPKQAHQAESASFRYHAFQESRVCAAVSLGILQYARLYDSAFFSP